MDNSLAYPILGFAILSTTLSSFAGTLQQQKQNPETLTFQRIGLIIAILTIIALVLKLKVLLILLVLVILGLYTWLIFLHK